MAVLAAKDTYMYIPLYFDNLFNWQGPFLQEQVTFV